jgi:hypothetical protein
MNQNTQTRIRTAKDMDTVTVGRSEPIKSKSSIPRESKRNPKRQHNQLTGNHTVCAPTSAQPKWKKQLKELKK